MVSICRYGTDIDMISIRCTDENPKVVCGSVLTLNGEDGSSDNDFIVLGRRNIQPRQGYWGIPAGTYFDV